MSKDYRQVAKELGVKHHIWKWGVQFLPRDPWGHIYRLFYVFPLDGWITDPHEIIEAIANDPDFSISYQDQFSAPPSDDKKEGSHR